MLLPKRKINHEFMHKNLAEYEKKLGIEKPKGFKDLLNEIEKEDFLVFDEEDAIVVVKNPNESSKNDYLMIHYRFIDGKLKEMNRWEQRTRFFGPTNHQNITELNLFMVPGGCNIFHPSWDCCGSLYDYKTCKFVVPKGDFDGISMTNHLAGVMHAIPEKNYLKESNCFLSNFELTSEYEEGDILHYTNPITSEDMAYCFSSSEIYFAFLNIDGTIRGNKLFRGRNLSRIENTIDLENYVSLEEFKKSRRKELTKKKNIAKKNYYENTKKEQKAFISPYQDDEIMRLLELK